jgi:hypothetical protein
MFSERSTHKEVLSALYGYFSPRTDDYGKNVHELLRWCHCQVDVETDDQVTDDDYCYWFFYITLFVPPADMEFASTQEFRGEVLRAALLLTETTSEGDFRTEISIKSLDKAEVGRRPRRSTRAPFNPISIKPLDPAEPGTVGLNNGFFLREQTILHEGLRFRSQGEIAIYDELKSRDCPVLSQCGCRPGDQCLGVWGSC